MSKLVILQELRLCSERLPRKILEVVGRERLIDRGLRKLRSVQERSGIEVRVVCWGGDREITAAIRGHGLAWQPKSESSSRAESWVGQFDGWQHDLTGFDRALFINAVCHPFLTVDSICRMLEFAGHSGGYPWVTATMERGQVWSANFANTPLLPTKILLNSKMSPGFFRPNHVAMGCAIEDTMETCRILNPVPVNFCFDKLELVDIDTEEDLDFARIVADGLEKRV